MDRITLYSSHVYLAEDNSNPDSYIAKFIICDFGRNKNGVSSVPIIPNSIAYIFNIDVILYSTFICNVFFYVKY